jgi:hypothetical protein
MSHSSIDRAANDAQLQERVKAAVYKELYTDDECRTSIFGQALLNGSGFSPTGQLTSMYWAVAVATEAEYETAITGGNGSPGFDVTVIPDATITGVVQETWPREQPVPMTPAAPPAPPA